MRYGILVGAHESRIELRRSLKQAGKLSGVMFCRIDNKMGNPIVLGYRGFLERIRFALDPGVIPGEQRFYFGLAE